MIVAPNLHGGIQMISDRGTKVWPNGLPETFCTDHWRVRFVSSDLTQPMTNRRVLGLLECFAEAGVDVVRTENPYTFNGQPGCSLGQGQ